MCMSVHTHSRLQMPTAGSKPALEGAAPQFMQNRESPVLPTLFGDGYGLYQTRPETFLLSFVAHRQQIQQQVVNAVTDISPYILPASKTKAGGGGGGGDRDKLQASKGALPKFSREQITPP